MIKPIQETRVDELPVSIYENNEQLGQAAAEEAGVIIRDAVASRGLANIIVATANSQLTFLTALRQDKRVPWSQVNVFHMDEYVGLTPEHPASFPLFLQRHLLDYVTPYRFYP